MKKDEWKELMMLSVLGELDDERRADVEAYLQRHPEARREWDELEKFRTFMHVHPAPETPEQLVTEARTSLRAAVRKERNAGPRRSFLRELAADVFRPAFALSGAAMLSLGLFIGYCSFAPTGNEKSIVLLPASDREEMPKTSIANIRFIDSDASDGEVEFEFDAIAPMQMKGSIDDPEIQRLLTHALLNESNAGVRLSSVSAIEGKLNSATPPDPSVKSALITSLRSDVNPGVRREALKVLQRFPFDHEIRDVLLDVIAKDANAGLRVDAINALEIARMDGNRFDAATIAALKRQIEKEQNNYIRNRAVNLVKEIYQ